MMHTTILHLLAFASTSSGKNSGGIGLLFFLSGFVFYGIFYMKYRNINQRHHYEDDTEATKLDVTATDAMSQSLTGLSNARMRGANNDRVNGAGEGGAAKMFDSVTSQFNVIKNIVD